MSDENDEAPSTALGVDTVKYLGELASESFKRQAELDESVWRSLPFFAATFAFVATIIGRSAADAPAWSRSPYSWVANLLLIGAVCSLAWSLRWFWVVLQPREYEYPAPDALVRTYAEGTAAFHAASGVADKDIDTKTLTDMRLFMIDQYGSAAATNLGHNAVKLKARPKVLFFMLLGFALAFACEATIFLHTHIDGPSVVSGAASDGTATTNNGKGDGSGTPVAAATPAGAAQVATSQGGRRFLGREFQAGNSEQAMTRGRTPTPPAKPTASTPQRPTPPATQFVAKLQDGVRNQSHPSNCPKPNK
jgi:hypothetical protein